MNAPSANHSISNRETWQTAMQWVGSNTRLIHSIAGPYLRFMAVDGEDLRQEATIAAFKALMATKKKNTPQRLPAFFRVIFKTQCLKLASGVPTLFVEECLLNDHHCDQGAIPPEPFQVEIEEALQLVGKREREVCTWILEQAEPVSTAETAQHFRVSQRQACRLLQKSIAQITKVA